MEKLNARQRKAGFPIGKGSVCPSSVEETGEYLEQGADPDCVRRQGVYTESILSIAPKSSEDCRKVTHRIYRNLRCWSIIIWI